MSADVLFLDRLREILAYDRVTGDFTWLVASRGHRAGVVAGSINAAGYLQIKIDGHLYYGHRLALFYVNGVWPTYEGEHRNGKNADNSFDNLRDATRTVNSENLLLAHSDNRTGLLGVSWSSEKGKWYSRIRVKGTTRFLGYFNDKQLAHEVYVTAKRQSHEGNTL